MENNAQIPKLLRTLDLRTIIVPLPLPLVWDLNTWRPVYKAGGLTTAVARLK